MNHTDTVDQTIAVSAPQKNIGRRSQRRALETLLLLLLACYLFVDSANGFLSKTLSLPSVLSPLYKQGLVALLLIHAFIFERRRLLICLAILGGLFIWALIRFFTVDNIAFTYAFQEGIKAVYPFIIVAVVSRFELLSARVMWWIAAVALFVVLLNIIATFLGLGYSTYTTGFGARGFFYAGNALSGIMVIVASVFLVKSYQESVIKFLLYCAVFLMLAVIIGTKSGILGVFIIAFLAMVFCFDARALLLIILSALGLSLALLMSFEYIANNPIYERLVFFYESGGIERALFSGREEKLTAILHLYQSADLAQFLFGLDMNSMQKIGITRVEFDWIDVLINFGALFFIVIYAAHFFMLAMLFKAPRTAIAVAAIIASLVLLFVSSIAGHVLYNGTVTPLWAFLIAAALVNHDKAQKPS